MKYKFEDIIFNITEKKKPVEEDKYNYIGLEHLESGNLFISKWGSDTAPEGEKIVMKKGDVLFGKRRAYQKKVAISPIDGIFSAHGMVLRPKEDVICKEFLPFFISSETFLNEAIRISVGGLSPTVNWKDIKELKFDLPSLAEQKVLAEKLWAAYEVKQSYLKMIDATQEMVKSQFIEMFGTSESNDKGWPVSTFGERFNITSGGTPDTQNESYWNGDISWIGSNMCQNCILKANDGKYITKEGLDHSSAKIYKRDTVLVALVGATIGKVAYLQFETATNQNVAGIEVKDKNEYEPFFLYYLLQNMYNRFFMLGMGKFKMASLGFIKSLPLLIPPIEQQRHFVKIAKQADKSISELRKSVDAIDKVIKSLINENL